MTNGQKTTALAPTAPRALATSEWRITPEQVDLLKTTICRGATDDELKFFVMVCERMRLDPFARQIHAVKRWNPETQREEMAIQVGIDGFRVVAERTGNYAPGPKPVFDIANGQVVSCTATVKKFARSEWHLVEAEAFYDEYVQRKKDGSPNRMWATKPRVMLGKCAEAIALRKAFPHELSGIYTPEELGVETHYAAPPMPGAQQAKALPSGEAFDAETGEVREPGSDDDAGEAASLEQEISLCETTSQLSALVKRIQAQPEGVKTKLRAAYSRKQAELKGAA